MIERCLMLLYTDTFRADCYKLNKTLPCIDYDMTEKESIKIDIKYLNIIKCSIDY